MIKRASLLVVLVLLGAWAIPAGSQVYTGGGSGSGGGTTLTDSASLAAALSDETGTGLSVFGTSPTIVTPTIASFVNAIHSHQTNAGGGTLALAAISDFGTGVATFLATPTSANLAAAITNETGSGLAVFATSPVFTTPVLGAAAFTSLTGTFGTITTAVSPLSITETRNASGTTFPGIVYDVTNTAAAAASVLQDWQVGGTSVVQVRPWVPVSPILGIQATGNNTGLRAYAFDGSGTQISFARYNNDFSSRLAAIWSSNNSVTTYTMAIDAGSLDMANGTAFISFNGGGTKILSDANNTLALRNSTNANAFNIYNTFTSATSFESLKLDWITTANVAMIYTQKGAGGGTARVLQVNYGGTTTAAITIPITSGDLTFGGVLLPTGYKSSDGTAGATTTCTIVGLTSITVKNGLITGCT